MLALSCPSPNILGVGAVGGFRVAAPKQLVAGNALELSDENRRSVSVSTTCGSEIRRNSHNDLPQRSGRVGTSYREHEGREQRGAECEQPEAGNAKRTWFAPR